MSRLTVAVFAGGYVACEFNLYAGGQTTLTHRMGGYESFSRSGNIPKRLNFNWKISYCNEHLKNPGHAWSMPFGAILAPFSLAILAEISELRCAISLFF